MNEPFNLSVSYQCEELKLKARFERWGYAHRMAVLIGETTVTFEPDEEGGYRAIRTIDHAAEVKTNLLKAVADKLAN